MGKTNKNKGAERQQQADDANSEANASGSHMDASAEHTDTTPPSETPTATDIMSAITRLSQNVDTRFDKLQISLADLKQTMADIEERVTSNESGLNEHESRIKALEDRCARWEDTAQSLGERLDDLVSRSRRQNIRIIGVKEGMEVAKLIPKLLGEENFGNKPVKVDRAHRIRGRAVAADGPPRQIIARIHHESVKERILRLSSQKFPLQYEGARLHIFPDLGPAVMKQRQPFDSIRVRCRAAELRCGFRYPATFVVSVGSDRRSFNIPKDAERFLDDNKIPRQTDAPAKATGNN
ncbi:hypothetical protein ABVT39_027186 [Epinephelus coioides]